MKLIGRNKLQKIKDKNAQSQVGAWEQEIEAAEWKNPHDLQKRYPQASIIGGRNVVFNICGNRYRIWVLISYKSDNSDGTVLIKEVGTHKEYDRWDMTK